MPSPPHRPDLSPYLIHFTKVEGQASALEVLLKILKEKRLIASNGFVKGGMHCVSFTEAPFDVLTAGFCGPQGGERYSGLGLRFSKVHIFQLGGRPVCYQPDAEFKQLPNDLRWRHVRFEPPVVDWTWEREWRVCCQEIRFNTSDVEIVLPDEATESEFLQFIERHTFDEAWQWTTVLGDLAWQLHQPNPWKVLKLNSVRRPDPMTEKYNKYW